VPFGVLVCVEVSGCSCVWYLQAAVGTA
jgi:hypothetical protein